MSRERAFSYLQQAAYLLNFGVVVLVAGTMTYSIFAIVEAMEAEAFLRLIQVRPWKPWTMLVMAVLCYLFMVLFSCLGQLWEGKNRAVKRAAVVAEIGFCIAATVAMNMNYNGLVLIVVADMVRGQKGSRQKLVLGIALVGLYTLVNDHLMGSFFHRISWEAFLTCYSASTQTFLQSLLSVLGSLNLVLFILSMVMLIQGEYRERERILQLNLQLEEANRKLKEFAKEVIYRVIQEATTNAIRHGHADGIWITVSKADQWLTIRVKDNGTGCAAVEEGFGLKHMQERISLLDGSLQYDGKDGFCIIARIPIRWGEEYENEG